VSESHHGCYMITVRNLFLALKNILGGHKFQDGRGKQRVVITQVGLLSTGKGEARHTI